ncbi:MAG TPA: YiiX/YebB-like N1pC/P60 family cysteine hydrolase [Vicinamibacteria bacterium]|nr:YiiX/YebB-like N1pC/P60 family cysteine hydrolase [Vicinamibacteria bacterium]
MNDRSRPPLGRGLLSGGYVLVALGLGIAFGYWASDWEIRFFPTVVLAILFLMAGGLSLFAVGAQIEREESSPRRLGRRAALSAGLAVAVVFGIGLTVLSSRPTALTTMADFDLRRTHEVDARYFRDLDRTLRGLVARMESRGELFSGNSRLPTDAEERFLLDVWASFLDSAIALDELRRFHEDFYRFDLSRMERVRHLKSFLVSFASELSLFESSCAILSLIGSNGNVERFLNLPRPERGIEGESVTRMREELSGLTDLGRISAGKRYLAYLEQVHQARSEMAGESFSWLWDEVEHYVSLAERRGAVEAVSLSAASDFAPILRGVKRLSFPVQKDVAEWMGDTRLKRAAGHYLVSAAQAQEMEEALEPGDVLLSRKNWYLSNLGLPGFWPHAILYVGSNEALSSAFDSDPDVLAWVREASGRGMSFSQYVRESYPLAWERRARIAEDEPRLTVIEAVSEGVIQNSVHGASGDFIAALRPRLSPRVKAQAIYKVFSFLERPYDFDFDFATDHALVCTEVVWRAYRGSGAGLDIELSSIAGRLTLPANEIARSFLDDQGREDPRFDFVYYLEGLEQEARASAAGIERFLATVDRSKWNFGDE